MGQGQSRQDAIRRSGVVAQVYYRWRKQSGAVGPDQLKELKRLQQENELLRPAVTLDKLIMKEAARGTEDPRQRSLCQPRWPPSLH